MDKLLQNLIKKRLQKSFPGSLQIWKQGNPRHQMFLFYFIPLEGEPYQLREGTQSPSFMGAGSGTEAAPHRARPQHGPQLLPRTMFLEGRAQGLGPRFSLHACSLAPSSSGSAGPCGPFCPHTGPLFLGAHCTWETWEGERHPQLRPPGEGSAQQPHKPPSSAEMSPSECGEGCGFIKLLFICEQTGLETGLFFPTARAASVIPLAPGLEQ